MEWLANPQAWLALITLTVLEIVLGVDNVIFIAILAGKLPEARQRQARLWGLGLAMFARVALLFSLFWIMSLVKPLFTIWENEISGRDLILLAGGLFLLAKSTHEIHNKLEGSEEGNASGKAPASFAGVLVQIILLDIVFSFDSVITAVGMANHIEIMVAAVIIAVAFMMVFSGFISDFVNRHPTIKMLALSFLLLIGVSLIAEGLDQHIPKGYIYFAMAFSVLVEILNMKMRKQASAPVKLRGTYPQEQVAGTK